jgi:hypothetical protein
MKEMLINRYRRHLEKTKKKTGKQRNRNEKRKVEKRQRKKIKE